MPFTTPKSNSKNITSASVTFDTTLRDGVQYVLRSNTALWYRLSTAGTAAVKGADDNHFLPAGGAALIGKQGGLVKVTAIRDSADGQASLSELVPTS